MNDASPEGFDGIQLRFDAINVGIFVFQLTIIERAKPGLGINCIILCHIYHFLQYAYFLDKMDF